MIMSSTSGSAISVTSRRTRLRSGKHVNVKDWEKQNQLLTKWNDELCSAASVPEVEIISLLEEQIPKYKLRADTLTQFGGYENQDWFIPSPALQVDEADLKLSPDQIRETLNYFLLCSERVSQMSKTYDDIEAVTRLLEEKEKDLELTARIGKELLQVNNKLETSVTTLESELKSANEKITQLSHEVSKKTELIQVLSNDMDEHGLVETSTPYTGRINLELMQKRISSLEDENKSLKSEFCRLAGESDEVEAHEARLLKDIAGQLACSNSTMTLLEDELDRQKEENRFQHEQILALQAKLQETELKLAKFISENDEVSSLLLVTKENQNALALELTEFKQRYYEVEALLRDAQEQLKKLRKKQMPMARSSMFSALGNSQMPQFDSLQSELEMSMHSELSTDSGISGSVDLGAAMIPQFKRVFDTVRCASQNSTSSSDGYVSCTGSISSAGYSSGPRMSAKLQTDTATTINRRSSSSIYSSSSLGYPSLDSVGHSDNESSHTDSDDGYPAPPQKGVPGVPGATELEAALKRLTPAEVLARRTNLQYGPTFNAYETDSFVPYGCRTPDSLMSTGASAPYYPQWRLPEKLQIVKPLEGSQTLHQWAQLAQPTFGGLLDERPGVKIKGGKELEDMGLETYALSDLEEDEEYANPGKMFDSSAPVYTLTNSTVMHPDDGTMTPSIVGSRVTSVCSSIQNSPPQTPRGLSRRNSCSTFSTTLGLAKMLNERGIKAVTPSAVNTPCGIRSFTPTETPCNSPLGSPDSTRSSSPEPYDMFGGIQQMILNTMPEFVQQTFVGTGAKKKIPPTIPEESTKGVRKVEKVNLVGKIERMGLSNIMSSPGALTLTSGMYARPALTSPMAQLTCLLPSHSNENLAVVKENQSQNTSAATGKATSLGIPGKPGSDSLNKRLEQLNSRKQRRQKAGGGQMRPDLGTVSTKKTMDPTKSSSSGEGTSTLGTLSSLLFGRKGGLF